MVKTEGRGTGSLLFMMRPFILMVGGRFRILCCPLSIIFSSIESKGASNWEKGSGRGWGEGGDGF